ncbi:MAG: tetratricopeptide repeat protein [Gemmataceae bacterium]|nr:tetratricopeptide repeat protein [Gemmataceae bacterium]
MRSFLFSISLLALAAAPPPAPDGRQAEALREAERLWTRVAAEEKAGKRLDALDKIRRVIALRGEVFGPASTQADAARHVAAKMHAILGQLPEAIERRREILRSRESLHERGHWRILDARLDLEEAQEQTKRTPEARRKVAEASRLGKQVVALYKAGESRKAVAAAEKALELRKEALGTRHRSYGVSLNNLAVLHQRAGDYRLALPLFREALEVNRRLLGTSHPDYATALNNLAMLLNEMGEPGEAMPLFRDSLALRRRLLGERHLLFAHSLNNLAMAHRAMGAHSRALPLYRRSLEIRADTAGKESVEYATALSNLSGLYREMGDLRAALRHANHALAVRAKAQGKDHPAYLSALGNVAAILQLLEQYREALPLTEEVLKKREEGSASHATTLGNLALIRGKLGDFDEAVRLQERANELMARALGKKHADNANGLNSLGVLFRDAGQREKALPLLEAALKLREERLGERHPLTASSLYNLAVLRHEMGDTKGALRDAEKAVAVSLAVFRDVAAVQPDRALLEAADALRSHLDVRLSLPDDKGTAYAAVLEWKGAVLQRQRERRLFARLRQDERTRAAAERLQDATRRLAALEADPASTTVDFVRAERAQEEAQEAMSLLARDFVESRKKPTPEALATALPEGTVLVDCLFYNRYGKARTEESALAHVVRKGKPLMRVELGSAATIRQAVEAWRKSIAAQSATEEAGAVKLHALVWKPLEKHLAGAKALLVCPDGVLASVPFAALPGKKEGTRLLEDVPVAVVPSPRSLLEEPSKPAGASLLVVGGVDFGSSRWQALPATADEARAVAKLSPKGRVAALAGQEATPGAVRKALVGTRVAHLATHGYFADSRGDHPLLQSGLVLAGGSLTALEVAESDLSGMELAVLSACETGLGEEASGEGLLGLQRAFQVAGCRAVVASLWQVPDAATALLMERFYGNLWKKGMPRAEALREAQLFVLRDGGKDAKLVRGLKLASGTTTMKKDGRTPPLAWAAWVVTGDGR